MRTEPFTCVVAVRPYGHRIRGRVFEQLRAAGLRVGPDDVIPDGTSDGDVIARLRGRAGCVLLIPYHAHHEPGGGAELTGLDLAQRIAHELPTLRDVPILMPVSVYAAPAVWLRLPTIDGALRARILIIDESDLDDPLLAARIREHVAAPHPGAALSS